MNKKRIASILIALMLIVGLLPFSAYAQDNAPDAAAAIESVKEEAVSATVLAEETNEESSENSRAVKDTKNEVSAEDGKTDDSPEAKKDNIPEKADEKYENSPAFSQYRTVSGENMAAKKKTAPADPGKQSKVEELPGKGEDEKQGDKCNNGGGEETVTKPMLRSTSPVVNAPLQNGGLRAGQTFYLDLKYEGDGEVTASKHNGTVGTIVEIRALPSDGYRFKNWEIVSGTGSIGAENNNLTTFTMGTTDATVKAVFEILPSTETSLAVLVVDPYNVPPGTASATVDPNNPTSYTLTATPASGYEFDYWKIVQGNGSIDNKYAASTTIRNCSGSVVVLAHFVSITYPITTNANPGVGGSAACSPPLGGPARDVDLKATPNDGYVFKEWKITSGTGRITNPTEAFTVLTDITGEVTCQAVFEQIPSGQYRVSVTKIFAEVGEAAANVPYASPGTEVTLTATPASGYKFNGWKVSSQNVTLNDPNSATTTFTIGSEDVNVIAYFIPDEDDYNVTTQTYGCGRALSYIDQAPSGSRVGLEAIPASGWSFDHWEVVSGGVTIDNEYAKKAGFVMRDQDVAVRAVFVPEQTNPLTEIKVTNPPKKDTYTAGESFDPDGMVVTAYYQNGTTDVSGYTYEPSGALAETDTLITIRYTINGVTKETTLPITVSPRPAPAKYNISYWNLKGTSNSNPVTYTIDDTPIPLVSPTGATGYTFDGWYDNAAFSGNAITEIPANSTGDKTFYAKWTADIYNISYQNVNGASNSNPATYTIDDTPLTLVPLVGGPTGHTFDGWYDNASFSGSPITAIPAGITGDKTFYAKWKKPPTDISEATVAAADQTYDGTEQKPAPTVTWNGTTLAEGTDYEVSEYANNLRAGTANITVTGKGSFTGTASGEFTIAPAEARITVDSASKVQDEADPTFTGTVEGLIADGDLGEITYSREGNDEAPGTYKGVLIATYTENPNYNVTVTKGDFTITEKPVDTTTYKAVSGSGGTYTKGSGSTLVFTFKRSIEDSSTFEHFTGIEVDGKAVPQKDSSGKANWTAKSGSVIIDLQPEYLDGLEVGQHTLTALFDDGTAEAGFEVLKAEEEELITGKDYYPVTWDPDGGTFDDTDFPYEKSTEKQLQPIYKGSELEILKAPVRDGYRFLYWECDGQQYQPGDKYTVEKKDRVFTAVWEKIEEENNNDPSNGSKTDPKKNETSGETSDNGNKGNASNGGTDNTDSRSSTHAGSPETGDESNTQLWTLLICPAIAGLIFVIYRITKRKKILAKKNRF